MSFATRRAEAPAAEEAPKAEAAAQTARDIVFAATFPHLKGTSGRHATVARIETQHDFTEGNYVPFTFVF